MTKQANELLPCVEIEPRSTARACVIWLHGLGADGHDFEPIVPELGVDDLALRFVFPHAPRIPVSLNAGMVMPAWYDIRDLDPRTRHDPAGIARSQAQIEALIAREKQRGIAAAKIVLAGFSQGGAIALHVALRHPERLAGLVALSTYLVSAETLATEAAPANRDLPVLMVHGQYDPMVPYDRGVTSCKRLTELGWGVEFKTYPMMHEVCWEELQDVAAFLREALA